ncbi:unnamed protein product, partial [Candidula unifasciata]
SQSSFSQASIDSVTSDPDSVLRDLGIPITDASGQTLVRQSSNTSACSVGDLTMPTIVHTSTRKHNIQLSVAKVNELNIPPCENVTYNKETQTIDLEPLDKDGKRKRANSHGNFGMLDYYGFGSAKFVHPKLQWEDEFFDDMDEVLFYDNAGHTDDDTDSLDVSADISHGHGHHMPHVEPVAPPEVEKKVEEKPQVRELSEEEKKQIMMSEDYQLSVSRAARIMQRMLALNDTGLTIDYSGGDSEGKDDDSLAGEKLKLQQHFFDERWSKRRTITSMGHRHLCYPELLLASYNANEDAPNDPDGVALIWNMKFKNMDPEYIFHCQ